MRSLVFVILLSGCSLLPQAAKDKIVSGVDRYCRETSETRSVIRADVSAGR